MKNAYCRKTAGLRAGLTLVEVMVAGSLLSIVFAIGWVISNSFSGIGRVRSFEIATSLAQQTIEVVRATRFSQLGSDGDNRKDTLVADFMSANNMFDGDAGEGFVPVVEIGGIEFRRQVSITDVPSRIDRVSSGLKLIRVVVTWRAVEDGAPLTFEVVTTQADQW